MKAAKEKPRRYRAGSKYDPILDAFLEGKDSLVEVSVECRDANCARALEISRLSRYKIEKMA